MGTAYLLAKDGVTIDNNDSAADAPSSTDISTPSEPSAGADTDTPRPARSNFSLAGVLVTILIVLLVLAVISLISWLIYSKKKEARALAERRDAADKDSSALVTKKSLSVFCLNTKTKPERNNPDLAGFTTDRNQISP